MIYLLRHGEIEKGPIRLFVGQSDIPLNREGRRQASLWADRFSGILFDRIVASPLSRTLETARIVAGERRTEIVKEPAFKEIHLGTWDGRPMDEIRAAFPAQWEERGRNLSGFRPPGGESFQDLSDRVLPVFNQLSSLSGNSLFVTHAGVIRVISCSLKGIVLNRVLAIPSSYAGLTLLDNRVNPPSVVMDDQSPDTICSASLQGSPAPG